MSDHRRCNRCGAQYLENLPGKGDNQRMGVCPTPLCWTMSRWSDEQWSRQAEMAENRKLCGIPLNEVDIEALHRARLKPSHLG